jgi:hypothetical protein
LNRSALFADSVVHHFFRGVMRMRSQNYDP